jgi:hypothetical protein
MEDKMSKLIGFAFATCLVAQPSFGADSNKIIGTWKLVSYETEVQADGKKEPAMGQNPTGYVVFNAEGRVFLLVTGDARKPAKTAQERAELFTTLIGYTGTYRLDGDKWTTKVEVSWIPEWVGTEQVRSLTVDGDRLNVMSPWRVNPNWADKGMTRSIVTFARSK